MHLKFLPKDVDVRGAQHLVLHNNMGGERAEDKRET